MSEFTYPEFGDRVLDTHYNCKGTVTGLRSGMGISVTWDEGHPFTDNPTRALFEDIEHLDECGTCKGTGWHDEAARIGCGECQEPNMDGPYA